MLHGWDAKKVCCLLLKMEWALQYAQLNFLFHKKYKVNLVNKENKNKWTKGGIIEIVLVEPFPMVFK